MRTFLFLIILSAGIPCHSQSDTVILNTPKVFSITCLDTNKNVFAFDVYSSFEEVYLDTLTNEFLVFERRFTDLNNPLITHRVEKISLKDIKSLGYISGSQKIFGLLLGACIGVVGGIVLGSLAESQDKLFDKNAKKSIGVSIVAGFLSGGAIGYLLGDTFNKYETYNLEKYEPTAKYSEILKIVQRGMRINNKNY